MSPLIIFIHARCYAKLFTCIISFQAHIGNKAKREGVFDQSQQLVRIELGLEHTA